MQTKQIPENNPENIDSEDQCEIDLSKRRILLIDDVITTGQTLARVRSQLTNDDCNYLILAASHSQTPASS